MKYLYALYLAVCAAFPIGGVGHPALAALQDEWSPQIAVNKYQSRIYYNFLEGIQDFNMITSKPSYKWVIQ